MITQSAKTLRSRALHASILLHEPQPVSVDHRYHYLLLCAVAEAKQQEGVTLTPRGVGGGTQQAHLMQPVVVVVQLGYIHAHVVDELTAVAIGYGVGTIMAVHELGIMAVQQIFVVESGGASCHLRRVVALLATTGKEQQGSEGI